MGIIKSEETLIMIFCPFCDGYGLINEAIIRKSGVRIYICEECDTMWTSLDIRENNCQNFEKFMNDQGLQGLWRGLMDIKRL